MKFSQAMSLAQNLGLTDVVDKVLKPAAIKLAQAAARNPADVSGFWRAISIARQLNVPEALDALKIAGCKAVVAAVADLDNQARLSQALYLAQSLNLSEALEGVVRPAVRKHVLAMLERSDELGQLTQAGYLANRVGLRELLDDTLKPVVRRRARAMLEKAAGVMQIYQVHNVAHQLAMPDLSDDVVKPALRKWLASAKDRPVDRYSFSQVMYMARALQMKEAVPFAIKAALDRKLDSWSRGSAVCLVGTLGNREQAFRLEPLLKDTTNVGQNWVNGTTCRAQLRDAVLGVLVVAAGEALADYGFPYFRAFPAVQPFTGYAGVFGFAKEADRDAALKKWQKKSSRPKK
jgi:hypothetical protein